MNKLSIAYFGSPVFSAVFLDKILAAKLPLAVSLVVTLPDKPIGREQTLTPSPVKQVGIKHHLEIYDNNDLSDLPKIIKEKQIDLGLVFSYGKIINLDLLSSPKIKLGNTGFGFLNLHPSLLPKYRGASPIVFPLLLGDHQTGVSLMAMDEQMDHGPIVAQENIDIEKNDNHPSLITKLTDLAYNMFLKTVSQSQITNHKLPITQQNHNFATYTRPLTRQDGFITLELIKKALKGEVVQPTELPEIYKWYQNRNQQPATSNQQPAVDVISCMFRALTPWPGLWTTVVINNQQKRLLIKQISYIQYPISITRVQLEGKNEVSLATFNQAYQIF